MDFFSLAQGLADILGLGVVDGVEAGGMEDDDRGGVPGIIDFGFSRYAPFYIDLAGWFTPETLRLYYDALVRKGISLRYGDFEERAKTAFRYSGFIYLCPSVMDWRDGPTEQTGKRLLQSLHIILTGDFPEKARNYSASLFSELLGKHKENFSRFM